jgi:hypothetical protein
MNEKLFNYVQLVQKIGGFNGDPDAECFEIVGEYYGGRAVLAVCDNYSLADRLRVFWMRQER